jgi:hypothetical protein
MDLTRRQRRQLRKLVSFRERPPGLWRMLLHLGVRLICWSIVMAAVIWAIPSDDRMIAVLVTVGMLAGLLAANVAQVRLFLSAWPIYDAVIDWEKAKAIGGTISRP